MNNDIIYNSSSFFPHIFEVDSCMYEVKQEGNAVRDLVRFFRKVNEEYRGPCLFSGWGGEEASYNSQWVRGNKTSHERANRYPLRGIPSARNSVHIDRMVQRMGRNIPRWPSQSSQVYWEQFGRRAWFNNEKIVIHIYAFLQQKLINLVFSYPLKLSSRKLAHVPRSWKLISSMAIPWFPEN